MIVNSDDAKKNPVQTEKEKTLLAQLEASGGENVDALWDLAEFYSTTSEPMAAMKYVEKLSSLADNAEDKAHCYLSMGQIMERNDDNDNAIKFYKQAFALEPMRNNTWYLINNNLGYCLNQLGRYAEATSYCMAAIKINPERHNAYKNLGLAFEGKGEYPIAAKCFFKAVMVNAADPRSLAHLENLIEQHSELLTQLPELSAKLEECRKAVKAAAEC